MIVSERYEICDAIKVGFNGNETFSVHPLRTYANQYSINSGELSITGRNAGGLLSNFSMQCSGDWECTFDSKITSGDAMRAGIISESARGIEDSVFGIRNHNSGKANIDFSPNTSNVTTITTKNLNTYYSFKLTAINGILSIYIDDSLISTYNNCEWLYDNIRVYCQSWSSATFYMKNLVFKPL